ncbi:MAG TPA: hypothetical protein QF873_02725 [Patescibacteria group bacterium]|nr:hypothetical protein [Patescibacteria group bacterium]
MTKILLTIEALVLLALLIWAARRVFGGVSSKKRLEIERKTVEQTFIVTGYLYQYTKVALTDLQRAPNIDNETLTTILRTLKKKGYVKHRPSISLGHSMHSGNGRVDYYWLTPEGRTWATELLTHSA